MFLNPANSKTWPLKKTSSLKKLSFLLQRWRRSVLVYLHAISCLFTAVSSESVEAQLIRALENLFPSS